MKKLPKRFTVTKKQTIDGQTYNVGDYALKKKRAGGGVYLNMDNGEMLGVDSDNISKLTEKFEKGGKTDAQIIMETAQKRAEQVYPEPSVLEEGEYRLVREELNNAYYDSSTMNVEEEWDEGDYKSLKEAKKELNRIKKEAETDKDSYLYLRPFALFIEDKDGNEVERYEKLPKADHEYDIETYKGYVEFMSQPFKYDYLGTDYHDVFNERFVKDKSIDHTGRSLYAKGGKVSDDKLIKRWEEFVKEGYGDVGEAVEHWDAQITLVDQIQNDLEVDREKAEELAEKIYDKYSEGGKKFVKGGIIDKQIYEVEKSIDTETDMDRMEELYKELEVLEEEKEQQLSKQKMMFGGTTSMPRGSGWGDYEKGDRVLKKKDLIPGNMYLSYSGQFDAKNVVYILPLRDGKQFFTDKIFFAYVDPKSKTPKLRD